MIQKFRCIVDFAGDSYPFKNGEVYDGIATGSSNSWITKVYGIIPPALAIFDPVKKEWKAELIHGWEPVGDDKP